jgi:uroporphyrinogen III methyltransferase/synthase
MEKLDILIHNSNRFYLNSKKIQDILVENELNYSFTYTDSLSEDRFNQIKDIRFFKHDSSVFSTNADIYILHNQNFGYPLPQNYEVVALFENEQVSTSTIKDIFENALVILGKRQLAGNVKAVFKKYDLRQGLAKVYLVGAGTGSKSMLTLKAYELIHSADIVFYDNLVNQDIIDEISAQKVFVGKKVGNHSLSQAEINQMLYEASFEQKTIVRLKGGDPIIFGHAGEEVAFLESKQIQVEIVPGISSAQAAAAISKTPFTLRGISKSVAFCSGHEKTNIQVPAADTIVYFMGAHNIKNIAGKLVDSNFPLNTGIKLIYNIGEPDQQIFDETIESILNKENKYKSPIIIIVGDVVNKHNWWNAFSEKKRILYTGTHIANYVHLGYVTHHPMIQLVSLPDAHEIDNVIASIAQFDIVIFTSIYAVKFLFERISSIGMDSRIFAGVKIVSIGSHTSSKLKEFGLLPDLQPKKESSEGIIELINLKSIKNSRILLPRSDKATSFLPNQLRKTGNTVDELKVYTNVVPDTIRKLNPESFDEVIFSSPSCVDNFVSIYGAIPLKPHIVYKGGETLKALKKHGYNDVE